MDKLAAMRAFVEIADRGSLTAAGRALDRSSPAMVRTLAQLEEALGTRLIRRTTRRMALTDEGRIYLDRCRRILADVEEAERALGSDDPEPRGEIRMSAPVTFGQWHVAPLAARFAERHPGVRIDLLLLDRIVDLLDEGIDVALRIGQPTETSLIAAPIGRIRRVAVASPRLIERVGSPSHPQALADLPCVVFRGLVAGETWRFESEGRALRVRIRGRFATNHAVAGVEACAAGLGFGLFLAYQVEPWLRDGRLQTVLEPFEPEPMPVSLLYAERQQVSTRLRAFMDFLKRELRLPPS